MKKTNLIVAAVLVCSMALVNNTSAQTSKNVSFLMDTKTLGNALSVIEPADAINSRAMRDFKKKYPNVNGETWSSFSDGFVARFNEDGVRYMITYNRLGGLLYNISYYGEKKLPKDVRELVKSSYYDYSITGIQQIIYQRRTIYLVHMQDETTWKIVRVEDGEMSVLEDFLKG